MGRTSLSITWSRRHGRSVKLQRQSEVGDRSLQFALSEPGVATIQIRSGCYLPGTLRVCWNSRSRYGNAEADSHHFFAWTTPFEMTYLKDDRKLQFPSAESPFLSNGSLPFAMAPQPTCPHVAASGEAEWNRSYGPSPRQSLQRQRQADQFRVTVNTSEWSGS
jgi:hypothetical protein